MVMGEFDFVGICAPDDAIMARYVLQLGGFDYENAEGIPGDRLSRNHPLARLSRVGCSLPCVTLARAIATSSSGWRSVDAFAALATGPWTALAKLRKARQRANLGLA